MEVTPYPVISSMARGILNVPAGALGDALRPHTPLQRAIILAEILGPPGGRTYSNRSRATLPVSGS